MLLEATAGAVVSHMIRNSIITGAFSLGGWLFMFPLRTLIKAVKTQWDDTKKELSEVKIELATQRTNCLTTIQRNGEEQLEVSKAVLETLNQIHTGQSEMTGYLKGITSK